MKWIGLVLFWIEENHLIRSYKSLVSELRNSMAQVSSIFLFITYNYYLGRMLLLVFTKKLRETSKMEERKKERRRNS